MRESAPDYNWWFTYHYFYTREKIKQEDFEGKLFLYAKNKTPKQHFIVRTSESKICIIKLCISVESIIKRVSVKLIRFYKKEK